MKTFHETNKELAELNPDMAAKFRELNLCLKRIAYADKRSWRGALAWIIIGFACGLLLGVAL